MLVAPASMIDNIFSVVRILKVGNFDLKLRLCSSSFFTISRKLKSKLLFFQFPT